MSSALFWYAQNIPHLNTPHMEQTCDTDCISVGNKAKLWKLYLIATIPKINVFGKKVRLALNEGQVLRSRMHITGKKQPGVQLNL